jgi:uncharacterized protein (TIGR04222 family)
MVLELLEAIPGPVFLVLYFIFMVFVLLIGYRISYVDGSKYFPLPDVNAFDPGALALLNLGTYTLVETVVFNLWKRGLLVILAPTDYPPTKGYKLVAVPKRKLILTPIEREIYEFTRTPRERRDLLNKEFRARMELYLEPAYQEFERLHLIRTKGQILKTKITFWVIFFIFFFIGGTKILLGLANGRPTNFLIALWSVSLFLSFILSAIEDKKTQLGRKYMKAVKKHYKWIEEMMKKGEFPKGVNPTYCVAVYGASTTRKSPIFGLFGTAFASQSSSDGYGVPGCGGCGGCGG